MADSNTKLRGPPRVRMMQNFHLVWLDENIDENHNDCRNSIKQLREVVNTVNTFINIDDCIDFITDMADETAFMLVSEIFSQDVIPVVQDIFQLKSVYIICKNKTQLGKCDKKWPKIKGVYTDITSICKTIRRDSKAWDHNATSISFIKQTDDGANQNLDTLDCSFMYTQILKDILLTIDFKQEHIDQFLAYCREQFADSTTNLEVVNKIESEYYHHSSIWWYTSDTFLYSLLNKALRLMDVDVIVKIGFFLRDLHQHITTLHVEQFGEQNHANSFTVYRGQGLYETDFNQLKNTQGGLLSFNNFLSTSFNRAVCAMYAESNLGDRDLIGILFEITVDPSVSVTSFVNVKDMSSFEGEEEILFTMHSVFRIGEIKQIDGNEHLWQVKLTLTSDNDLQLHDLTKRLQEETSLGSEGWLRLGQLMVKLGQFDKAEELYRILLEQTNDQSEKAHLYHMLGIVNGDQGNYAKAVTCYAQSLEISKNIFPSNHPYLVSSYGNIGVIYNKMGEYSQALEYYKISLDIRQKLLPENHSDLAACYNNIGGVYNNMGEYSKALEYYEKSLKICQNALPGNHPDLATSYNNIGMIYRTMSDYFRALNYYQKGLEIQQKTLRNHPNLAISYDNIGLVYMNVGENTKALEYYQKSLDNRRKSLSANHPYLANSYNNIGLVYSNMAEYSKALEYYEKSLKICQNALSANHPNLATSYNNIGLVYNDMSEHSKALEYHEKSLDIRRKSLPTNHPDLANSYNNIGAVHIKMREYSKALEYFEKALKICQNTLPTNHDDLATSCNNIGAVYCSIGEYSKALEYYEQSLDIRQRIFPANHPLLGTSYNNIGNIYYFKGDYSKSLTCFERTLDIWKRSLPINHPQIEKVKGSIEEAKKKL